MTNKKNTPLPFPEISGVGFCGISGFPGYCVGDDGSVWSCRKLGRVKKGDLGIGTEWKRLKPQGSRYPFVVLGPGQVWARIHSLVLQAFVGPCPTGMQCRHFPDPNTFNNNLSNLSWALPKTNTADQLIHGTRPIGDKNTKTKISESQVSEIRMIASSNPPWGYQRRLAERFGVDPSVICAIIKRRSRKRTSQLNHV